MIRKTMWPLKTDKREFFDYLPKRFKPYIVKEYIPLLHTFFLIIFFFICSLAIKEMDLNVTYFVTTTLFSTENNTGEIFVVYTK